LKITYASCNFFDLSKPSSYSIEFTKKNGRAVAAGKAAIQRVKVPSCQFPESDM
jgi:hypothetical protein